jgi:hypothetical protein
MISYWTILDCDTVEKHTGLNGGQKIQVLISDFCSEDLVVVYVSGDTLLDITINGKSIGYFAVKAFCDCYGFSRPTVLYHDVAGDISSPGDNEYLIPMFGELECVC